MRTKKYVEGGSIFTNPMPNAANSSTPPQSNVNMPVGKPQGQPQGQYPFPNDINVGYNTMQQQNPQTGMPMFRKGGFVKAADGIATKGKTKGRMV